MDTDKHGLDLEEYTREIIGCAFEVINDVGHGLHEKPYENALTIEFRLRNIHYEQQKIFPVLYKGEKIGEFIPDLIVFKQVIVDTKTIDKITHHEIGQMINYLRITKLKVGLIINFKHSKLEWKRVSL